jgi:hypothetical protein
MIYLNADDLPDGVAVRSAEYGVWATASFDNVSVNAGPPPIDDTTKPAVSISSPANGATVSSAIMVSAAASDNVGIAGVQFKVDGSNLGVEDSSAPYAVSWDTTSVANGQHTLTAVARDAAGNSATSSVTVTVSNTSAKGSKRCAVDIDRAPCGCSWQLADPARCERSRRGRSVQSGRSGREDLAGAREPGQLF